MSVITVLYAFNEEKAEKFFEKFFVFMQNTDNTKFNKTIDRNAFLKYISDIKAAAKYSTEDLVNECLEIYLSVGSVEVTINSAMGDDQLIREIETMCEHFKVDQIDSGIPTKEGFINIFSRIGAQDIYAMIEDAIKYDKYDKEEAEYYLVHTLQKLKPLVKELRDDANSILIVSHDYDWPNIIPNTLSAFFQNRAKKIAKHIEELLRMPQGDIME
jgi:hypothetical protein